MDWNQPYHPRPEPEQDIPQELPKGSQDPNIWPQPPGPPIFPYYSQEPLPDLSDSSTSCSTGSRNCYTTSNDASHGRTSVPLPTPQFTGQAYFVNHHEFPFYAESAHLNCPPADATEYHLPPVYGQHVGQPTPYPQDTGYPNSCFCYAVNEVPSWNWNYDVWQTSSNSSHHWSDDYQNTCQNVDNNPWHYPRVAPPVPEFVMPASETLHWPQQWDGNRGYSSNENGPNLEPEQYGKSTATLATPSLQWNEQTMSAQVLGSPQLQIQPQSEPQPDVPATRSDATLFACPIKECDKTFEQRHKLNKHVKSHDKGFRCNYRACSFTAYQRKDVNRHIEAVHKKVKIFCPVANCRYSKDGARKGICRKDALKRHLASHGLDPDLYMSRHDKSRATTFPKEAQGVDWNAPSGHPSANRAVK